MKTSTAAMPDSTINSTPRRCRGFIPYPFTRGQPTREPGARRPPGRRHGRRTSTPRPPAGRRRTGTAARCPEAARRRPARSSGIADLVAYGWCGSSSIGVSRTTAPPRWRCSSVGLLPATYTSSVGATGDPALAGTRAGSVAISRKYPGERNVLASSCHAVGDGSRRPQTRGYQTRLRDRATAALTRATTSPGSASTPAVCCAAAPIRVRVSGMVPRGEDGHGGAGGGRDQDVGLLLGDRLRIPGGQQEHVSRRGRRVGLQQGGRVFRGDSLDPVEP